jgi:hypothetical protein
VPAPVSPLARALDEALGAVAAPAQARVILRSALLRAGIEAPPVEPASLHRFVEDALLGSVEQALGRDAAELVGQQIEQVLRIVAPSIVRRATGTSNDADEASGERSVEPVPTAKSSDVRQPIRPRADIAAALRPPPRSEMPTPEDLAPIDAPILFPSRPRHNESGTQRKGAAVARITGDPTARRGIVETQGPRTQPVEVLLVTLDKGLATDLETLVGTRGRVTLMRDVETLTLALKLGTRCLVLIDATLPSIDVATLARHAMSDARIVLFGVEERQRARIAAQFPQAAAWIACADLAAMRLMLDRDG